MRQVHLSSLCDKEGLVAHRQDPAALTSLARGRVRPEYGTGHSGLQCNLLDHPEMDDT